MQRFPILFSRGTTGIVVSLETVLRCICITLVRMLPKEQLLRLSQEQEKTLLKTKSQLEQFKKFKSDYEILAQHLTTLPHRLEYPMMIPFGKKAFIPGKLVRTNELLVLLGENWFVECSAKYACEIVKRRIEHADKQIADASKEHDNISSHLKYTQEFSADNGNSNIHDIVEYEDEHGEITTIRGPNLEGGDKRLSKEEQARAIARVEAEMEELERIEQSLGKLKSIRVQYLAFNCLYVTNTYVTDQYL